MDGWSLIPFAICFLGEFTMLHEKSVRTGSVTFELIVVAALIVGLIALLLPAVQNVGESSVANRQNSHPARATYAPQRLSNHAKPVRL